MLQNYQATYTALLLVALQSIACNGSINQSTRQRFNTKRRLCLYCIQYATGEDIDGLKPPSDAFGPGLPTSDVYISDIKRLADSGWLLSPGILGYSDFINVDAFRHKSDETCEEVWLWIRLTYAMPDHVGSWNRLNPPGLSAEAHTVIDKL
ncbi:hypothetical protein V1523DRAFT_460959 [Lipomyces doorenjongii]